MKTQYLIQINMNYIILFIIIIPFSSCFYVNPVGNKTPTMLRTGIANSPIDSSLALKITYAISKSKKIGGPIKSYIKYQIVFMDVNKDTDTIIVFGDQKTYLHKNKYYKAKAPILQTDSI